MICPQCGKECGNAVNCPTCGTLLRPAQPQPAPARQQESAQYRDAFENLTKKVAEIGGIVDKLGASGVMESNVKMSRELDGMRAALDSANRKIQALADDNAVLERNLRQEMAMRRIRLVQNAREVQNRELYEGLQHDFDRLQAFRMQCEAEIQSVRRTISAAETEQLNICQHAWAQCHGQLQQSLETAQKRAQQLRDAQAARQNAGYDEILHDRASLEGSAIRAARKFFQADKFVGLKILSALGVLLLLFGAFTGARYVYGIMPQAAKFLMLLALGLVLLGVGEFLNKKWRGIFSITLTAGGVAELFITASTGYLTLHVISRTAALALIIVFAGAGFLLSRRYASQTIAIFALIGGYMPILIFPESQAALVFMGIYLSVLCVFALTFSLHQRWTAARFIGLAASLVADMYIIIACSDVGLPLLALGCVAVSFLSYQLIPIVSTAFAGFSLKAGDTVLLALNSVLRYLVAWAGVVILDLEQYDDALPLFFAMSCVILAFISEIGRFSSTVSFPVKIMLFIAAVTYTALTVPFLLDTDWFSLGWLVLATGLLVYGLLARRRRYIVSGVAVGSVALFTFLLVDVTFGWISGREFFLLKYFAVTLASVVVCASMKKYRKALSGFIFPVACNAYGFLYYLLYRTWTQMLADRVSFMAVTLSVVTAGYILSYVCIRLRPKVGWGAGVTSVLVGAFAGLRLIIFAFSRESRSFSSLGEERFGTYLLFGLFLVACFLSVLWLAKQLEALSPAGPASRWQPVVIIFYCLFLLSGCLLVHTSLRFGSIVYTLLFAATSLVSTLHGFWKNNTATRRVGLGFALFSAVKLFIFDLTGKTVGQRMVSYISLGAVLLGISLVYQYFEKKYAKLDALNAAAAAAQPAPARQNVPLKPATVPPGAPAGPAPVRRGAPPQRPPVPPDSGKQGG